MTDTEKLNKVTEILKRNLSVAESMITFCRDTGDFKMKEHYITESMAYNGVLFEMQRENLMPEEEAKEEEFEENDGLTELSESAPYLNKRIGDLTGLEFFKLCALLDRNI